MQSPLCTPPIQPGLSVSVPQNTQGDSVPVPVDSVAVAQDAGDPFPVSLDSVAVAMDTRQVDAVAVADKDQSEEEQSEGSEAIEPVPLDGIVSVESVGLDPLSVLDLSQFQNQRDQEQERERIKHHLLSLERELEMSLSRIRSMLDLFKN